MKKKIIASIVLAAGIAAYVSANPLPEKQVRMINAFPPEIGIMFYGPGDIAGDTIYTTSGIAIVDSGVVGEENEMVILDSSNTSGFILNPECDSIIFPESWYNGPVRYGLFGVAPGLIRGHSVQLQPNCEAYEYWSFDFSMGCWGFTDVVINEINSHGTWGEGSDFIELYNRSDTPVSLAEWRIVCDTVYELPSGAVILPHGFYVIDGADLEDTFDMDFDADNVYLMTGSTDLYPLVDQLGWSSDHGENVSFMRYPDGDCESNFYGYNDVTSFSFENGFPSRGAPNRHESPGFVVIGTRALAGESWVDLHWTNPIWDPEYNASKVLRSFEHYPETPDDGEVVYQGDGQYVQDVDIPGQVWVYYTVFARNNGGEYSIPTDESRASIMLGSVGVIDEETLPRRISFLRCYPNPFNASVNISYGLTENSEVSVEIYNVVGQRVATLFDGQKEVGEHSINWNASVFPSGVYFARLEAGGGSETVKMVLLK
jgi:hypothetical protein